MPVTDEVTRQTMEGPTMKILPGRHLSGGWSHSLCPCESLLDCEGRRELSELTDTQ